MKMKKARKIMPALGMKASCNVNGVMAASKKYQWRENNGDMALAAK